MELNPLTGLMFRIPGLAVAAKLALGYPAHELGIDISIGESEGAYLELRLLERWNAVYGDTVVMAAVIQHDPANLIGPVPRPHEGELLVSEFVRGCDWKRLLAETAEAYGKAQRAKEGA